MIHLTTQGRMSRLIAHPINYWGGLGLDIVASLALIIVGTITEPNVWASASAFVLGVIAYSFLEYAFHRWLYHRSTGRVSVLHQQHHRDAQALIGAPFFFTIALSAGILFSASRVVALAPAAVFAGVAMLCYGSQSIIHHVMHHNPRLARGSLKNLRRHHLLHHHHGDGNFGLTTRLWDRLFSTEL